MPVQTSLPPFNFRTPVRPATEWPVRLWKQVRKNKQRYGKWLENSPKSTVLACGIVSQTPSEGGKGRHDGMTAFRRRRHRRRLSIGVRLLSGTRVRAEGYKDAAVRVHRAITPHTWCAVVQ